MIENSHWKDGKEVLQESKKDNLLTRKGEIFRNYPTFSIQLTDKKSNPGYKTQTLELRIKFSENL